ncbi:glycine receptor subunit alpha-2-like [Ptychodera flava]|uniref:glycine receptor subunit alpha-2-like n=1 Tax=Ptychodera flava TaxID=63121 RepID=UPI00396A5AC5
MFGARFQLCMWILLTLVLGSETQEDKKGESAKDEELFTYSPGIPDSLVTYNAGIPDSEVPVDADLSLMLMDFLNDEKLRIRPNIKGPAVAVYCGLYICSFDSISETSMDYSVTMYVRQTWNDTRLQFNASNPIIINGSHKNSIWVPDLFFTNAKTAEVHMSTSTKESKLLRITPSGEVLYTIRMSVKLSCHMDLRFFPMDQQLCIINIESFSYATNDMTLEWLPDDAVVIDKTVKLPQYSINGVTWEAKLGEYLTGNFGQVEVSFRLVRQIGFYVLQAYIPSILLVVLSWLALWMEITSAPARVSLGITTVLALVTQGTWIRSQLPKIAYVTAIDIWLVSCQVFVFATLIEFALVYYMHAWEQGQYSLQRAKRASRRALKSMRQPVDVPPWTRNVNRAEVATNGLPFRESRPLNNRQSSVDDVQSSVRFNISPRKDFMDRAIMIDHVCRVFFPLSFIVFNIVYWYKFLLEPYKH